MPPGSAAAERTVKILKLSFFIAAGLLIFVTYRASPHTHAPASPAMELIIAVIALTDVAIGFAALRFLSKSVARPTPVNAPSAALQQWMSRSILSLAFFFSCNLFAMVLRFAGARASLVASLFAVGVVSMIVWSPGNAPADADGTITHS